MFNAHSTYTHQLSRNGKALSISYTSSPLETVFFFPSGQTLSCLLPTLRFKTEQIFEVCYPMFFVTSHQAILLYLMFVYLHNSDEMFTSSTKIILNSQSYETLALSMFVELQTD